MRRAVVGVDGDHAFALLGDNLQEGEAEFVKIECPLSLVGSNEWDAAAKRACTQAFRNLKARLVGIEFSYVKDPSHPSYC